MFRRGVLRGAGLRGSATVFRQFIPRFGFSMTPAFAQAIDPIFLYQLDLLSRLGQGANPSPTDERMRIASLIDQAEATIGGGREWDLAKYAIVSWIDEMLVEQSWSGREWWANNVLEVELFNTRLCNEQFFLKAREAATLARRDALEVFYNCVILGFRGLYRDPELAAMFTHSQSLPEDLPAWTRQVALAIRLGQGRPALAGPQREIFGAAPQRARSQAVWAVLAAIILIASNVIGYKLLLGS